MAKICLTMIVKNESKVIRRCMDSCRGLLDAVCITDTGSTDDTESVIRQWCQQQNLPVHINHYKFTTFADSRNESLRAAKEKFPGMLHLLMDADMTCHYGKDLDIVQFKSNLIKQHYQIAQRNGTISYYNTRLVGDIVECTCRLVTHEYWQVSEEPTRITELYLTDHNDGGARADKYHRDERLIKNELLYRYAEIPDHDRIRYYYYLAQTYRCLAKITNDQKYYRLSIIYYLARSISGGFDEEVYFSYYYLASCYKSLGDIDTAIKYYLEAYNHSSYRAEPLYHLAKIYRLRGHNQLGCLYASLGVGLPYPQRCRLFVNMPCYQYKNHLELAICGYYVQQYQQQAIKSYDHLKGIEPELPEKIKRWLQTFGHYYENLKLKLNA